METATPDATQLQPSATRARVPRKNLDLKEQAKALILMGLSYEAIERELGVQRVTLRSWNQRYKWRNLVSFATNTAQRIGVKSLAREVASDIQAQSARVRSLLASEVQAQAAVLESKAPALRDLANTPQRQGRTAVVKALAETAATVFDWDAGSVPGIVVIGEVERLEPISRDDTIDVSSAVVKDESTQVPDSQP